MARTGEQGDTRNKWWTTAFWFAGVVLFMMELNAGLQFLKSRFAGLAPNFLGGLPAWGLATFKLAESAFWNYGYLEAVFQIALLVVLPFALLGLALTMRGSTGPRGQQDNG